ncbi:response regulator [Herbiconiux sp. A18JL235]|uniref:Response regulator n=1 Tax=Herbiconiux sp. A18JL235 TaxID=3152363 RepID=A0AB39BFX4_9MICO
MAERRRIRVAVVEDQPLYRQMLTSALAGAEGLEVVAVASSCTNARAVVPDSDADVVVLDIQLGDGSGIDLGLELRHSMPRLGVLLLSATDSLDALLDLPRSSVRGWSYLSKDSALSLASVVRAIEVTAEGRTALDPELVERRRPRRGSGLARLSPRQYEVLRLLAQGLSNAGIAARLGIAPRSVDNHINAIYAELGLASGGVTNPRVGAALRFIDESSES